MARTEDKDYKYTATEENLKYTVIGDNIKSDFDFLTDSASESGICYWVGEAEKHIKEAASRLPFHVGSFKDIDHAYNQLIPEFEGLKAGLGELRTAIGVDIDNINAELELNFGYISFVFASRRKKEAARVEDSNGGA